MNTQPYELYLDAFDGGSDHPDFTVDGVYLIDGDNITLVRACSWQEYRENQQTG